MPENSKTRTGPSIRPSDFTNEPLDMSKYSLEGVVSMFKDTEKKRNLRSEPEDQVEVRWRVRSAPRELLSSIHVIAARLGVSQSVLTKCMSHQLADWFGNALGLINLEKEYNEVYNLIKMQTYSTLRTQAENPAKFSFVGAKEPAKTSISTIQWVVGKVNKISEFLGMETGDLLMLGFLWSLTTLEHREWDENTINRLFLPEVFNFETLISDRKIDIMALNMKYSNREASGYSSKIFVREKGADYLVS